MRRLQRREEYKKLKKPSKKKSGYQHVNLEVEAMGLGKRVEKALKEAEATIAQDLIDLLEKGDDALLALNWHRPESAHRH